MSDEQKNTPHASSFSRCEILDAWGECYNVLLL